MNQMSQSEMFKAAHAAARLERREGERHCDAFGRVLRRMHAEAAAAEAEAAAAEAEAAAAEAEAAAAEAVEAAVVVGELLELSDELDVRQQLVAVRSERAATRSESIARIMPLLSMLLVVFVLCSLIFAPSLTFAGVAAVAATCVAPTPVEVPVAVVVHDFS